MNPVLRLSRFVLIASVASVASVVACGGGMARPEMPVEAVAFGLSERTQEAFRAEAEDDASGAVRRYLALVDEARLGESPWHLAVARASLDALVLREITALRTAFGRSALAFRAPRTAKSAPELEIERELAAMHVNTANAIVKGQIARALVALAERRGDWASAERYRAARSCARSLTVLGPVDWTSLTALSSASPLDVWDAPLPASFVSPGPFGRRQAPAVLDERGCDVDLMTLTAETGVREVVVDVVVPRKQTIAIELRTRSAAQLRVGGELALVRPYELGDANISQVARAEVDEGRVRLVVRVAGEERGSSLGLSVWSDEGDPLAFVTPRAGERATSRASRAFSVFVPGPRTKAPSERLTLALGALAAGDAHSAERLLADHLREDPSLGLAYARAVDGALDLPQVQRAERARSAIQKVLEVAPKWWEAVLMSAQLAAVRRGEGEAQIQALRDLESHRARATSPMLDAFEATWASGAGLLDRANAAVERYRSRAGDNVLAAALREATLRVTTAEEAKMWCSAPANGALDRATLQCYSPLRSLGDHEAARREVARLRQLQGAARLYGPMVVRDAIAAGDMATAEAEFAKLLPGERSIAAALVLRKSEPASVTRDRLVQTLLASRESPHTFAATLTAVGEDRLRPFEGLAERLLADDRTKPAMPEAATVVLAHSERYTVTPSGLVTVLVHDLRRVGGTTDVEQNAQADAPLLLGRGSMTAVVRRVLKADGRVLLPERTPGAAQSHADLSQLGPGDAVEAVYEGFALPSETYDVGFDTPDLLPDRTAVVQASIEVRLPKELKVSMHAHPLLGEATTREEGAMRVLSYAIQNRPARRFEDGVPKMDRSVGISLTTANWNQVARALGETIRSLDENDPEVAVWATTAANGTKPSVELVSRIVTAAGESLRQPGGALFADFGVGRAGARQTLSARTFLAEREGSRTWLVARALRQLGIPTEIAVAEEEPYSTHPDFPARFGRFVHPLVIARVLDGPGKTRDLWIDADVAGPPLPPGRFSPELRGRKMLHADGRITQLPSGDASERDELDLRLALDAKGDAKGSFTAVLRGRSAQELADAFTRIVGDERQRALRNVVLGYVPTANVDLVVLSSSEGSWQIALRAEITVSGFAQPEKNKKGEITWVVPGLDPVHHVFPRPFVTTVTSAYASQGARQNALAINQALQYHFRRRIELPPGTRIVRTPGPLRVDGALLSATRTIAGGGKELEDDFVVGVRTGTVARDGYGAFVEDARRVDESFLASTRLAFP